jgi:hypothetical protein
MKKIGNYANSISEVDSEEESKQESGQIEVFEKEGSKEKLIEPKPRFSSSLKNLNEQQKKSFGGREPI